MTGYPVGPGTPEPRPEPIWRLSDRFVARGISGETLVVPVHMRISERAHLYVLNESAGALLEALREGATLSHLVGCLVAAYDVGPDEAEADVRQLLAELAEAGLLAPEG